MNNNQPVFRHVLGSGQSELQGLVEQIASGIGRVLERRGLCGRVLVACRRRHRAARAREALEL
jgi:hypothetical protein